MEKQMSLIEIALEIMDEREGEIDIYELIELTLARKGVTDTDGSLAAKLYTDITISSKFVFMGDNKWDLKSRQSLDQFDKDGSSFNDKDADKYEDDEEDEDDSKDEDKFEEFDDASDEDEDEDEDDSKDEDDEDDSESEDDSIEFESYDEEDEEDVDDSYDDRDADEEKYNKYMDDYEDLYED